MDCKDFRAHYPEFSAASIERGMWDRPEFEDWQQHRQECRECRDWDLGEKVRARGYDPADFPCVHIAENVTRTCAQHDDRADCPDILITRSARFDEYKITKLGTDHTIRYCPWCGVKLPPSRRDRYFEELGALDLDPWEDDIPEKYRGDGWYRET